MASGVLYFLGSAFLMKVNDALGLLSGGPAGDDGMVQTARLAWLTAAVSGLLWPSGPVAAARDISGFQPM
jgi:hypothetical protein